MIIVILGTPGAGRHTQANMLERHWGIHPVSLRDLIHGEIDGHGPLGQTLAPLVAKGGEIPDPIIFDLLNRRLEHVDFAEGVALNGFPVTVHQFKAFRKALAGMKLDVDHAVLIDVGDDESVRRLAGRRICPRCRQEYHIAYKPPIVDNICDHCQIGLQFLNDDQPDVARKRIAWFRQASAPLLAAYEELGILHRINGNESVETVHRSISNALGLSEWFAMKGPKTPVETGARVCCAHCSGVVEVKYRDIDAYRSSASKDPIGSFKLKSQRD
jgi:adenylate kinase